MDVFYDHFLASECESFSSTPLPEFATEVYGSFQHHHSDIPEHAYSCLERMVGSNVLCSYRELNGITNALTRIDSSFQKSCNLAAVISVLEQKYESFRGDFRSFFPELISHIPHVKSFQTLLALGNT